MAVALLLFTKTGLEHSGQEGLTDFTGSNRQDGSFTRYTEGEGLPSSTIRCIREDGVGRLWLSTQKGISRFDPHKETFRNYDVSDGLQSNEFSDGCYQGRDGEMFFGGSNGLNAFFLKALPTILSCRQ
jgi:streptogramin lyase